MFLKKIEKYSISLIIIRLCYNYSSLYLYNDTKIHIFNRVIAVIYQRLYFDKGLGFKDMFLKEKQLDWFKKLRLLKSPKRGKDDPSLLFPAAAEGSETVSDTVNRTTVKFRISANSEPGHQRK